MTVPGSATTAFSDGDGAAREARVAEIYRRGLEELRRAYDPERGLVASGAPPGAGARVYRPPASLWLAHALLRSGGMADIREATGLIAVVLETQERSLEHPHRGNFRWLADDREITDLNAVQFVLRALLPLLLTHGAALPSPLLEVSRSAVRLALEEEERLAVAPTYTNIHLMALFALVVGGEWLEDTRFRDLGLERWDAWVAFTAENGAPHEYNSPGYGATDLSALAVLQQYVGDPRVRLQARLFYERLWLHLALRLHVPTAQHAGPHSRCYWPSMTEGRAGLHDLLWRETGWDWLLAGGREGHAVDPPAAVELALTAHWLPDAARAWLSPPGALARAPYEVRETANRAQGADLTTYVTPAYALGTASRTYGIGQDDFYIEHQANYLLVHYRRSRSAGPSGGLQERRAASGRPPQREERTDRTSERAAQVAQASPGQGWGMIYSRYVVNDRHRGTLAAAPDRSPAMNFYDQGHFAGVQQHGRAIALYALMPQSEPVFSLKTVVAFPPIESLDEVWVDGQRVHARDLPRALRLGEWVVVADGDVYAGARPLDPSRLGREAPLLLERGPEGELWLTVYNYRGPAKRFWDYASLGGAFWRGNLRAGYVVELHGRDAYAAAPALFDRLRRATIRDTVEATPASPAIRTVTFTSGGETLQLQYDLWKTEPGERRQNGAVYTPPALTSPLAAQGSDGRLGVGEATLDTAPQPVWLIAQDTDPATRAWIAVNPEDRPTPLRLETPAGAVTAERWGLGRLELRSFLGGAPVLAVDALTLPEGLRVPAGVTVLWPATGT